MLRKRNWILSVLIAPILAACATYGPPSPTVAVYAGAGKTSIQFRNDDMYCRQVATSTAGNPAQARGRQVGNAFLSTALGAALGAAVGGGHGAAIGAASGAIVGIGAGSALASADAARIQQRWDVQYQQCMYNLGHRVPGLAMTERAPRMAPMPPPPPTSGAAPSALSPSIPCKPSTSRFVKTPQGLIPQCE